MGAGAPTDSGKSVMSRQPGLRNKLPWRRMIRPLSWRLRIVLLGSAAGLSIGLVQAGSVAARQAGSGVARSGISEFLATAEQGVTLAGLPINWGNRRFHWYN